MQITVIGAGSMGTACILLLGGNSAHRLTLWTRREDHADQLRSQGSNEVYLPGHPLPTGLTVETSVKKACQGAELAVLAIPTVHLRKALEPVADQWPADLPVVSVAKGTEQGTFLRPSQIIQEVLGRRPVGALCGPSHAEELANGQPASLVSASEDEALAKLAQEAFNGDTMRVYTNTDLVGVELGGALKNVIAIAAGVCDGMNLGDNAKAALLTRGLVEMVRFGTRLGGQQTTFYGLAGIGDLITTCVSPFGRNLSVGRKLGQGKTLEEILASTTMVAEGVWTARAIWQQSQSMQIEMPITEQIYQVLFEKKSPQEAVKTLMDREPKPE
ncbi:Glycerol-3-phosphate dehydrogenase [Planctomycetales bacterium 10988]|nr:Glycerol-3-phosphate dehydrogenase [Planctomycetales bacterium 10988]